MRIFCMFGFARHTVLGYGLVPGVREAVGGFDGVAVVTSLNHMTLMTIRRLSVQRRSGLEVSEQSTSNY